MPITTKSISPKHIVLTNGTTYPHSFNLSSLNTLLRFVRSHERSVLLKDYAAGDRDSDAICVRHDVDHSGAHAVRFAEWEKDHGIRASYYLLPTAPYYPLEGKTTAVKLQNLGHEVGVHNDAYTVQGGNADAALDLLRAWAEEMRSWGIDVHGCADHGGGEPSNTDLWRVENRLPAEAGLEYEAYLLHRTGTNYISDNHGKWNSSLKKQPDKPTHILLHPCHWELP